MPELPDVEVFRRYLNRTVKGKKIRNVRVLSRKILEVSEQRLRSALRGKFIRSTHRHGKYLFIETDHGPAVVLHFGMTGFVDYEKAREKIPKHARILFEFAKRNRLAYVNQRLFGHVDLTQDEKQFVEGHHLGPDASSLSYSDFKKILQGTHSAIKAVLMDQKRLAGIGNVYSDEILFQARIHPRRPVDKLQESEIKDLYRQMLRVFDRAIRAHAEPEKMPQNFLTRHRGEKRTRCPGCHSALSRATVGGRTSYFCPACQH